MKIRLLNASHQVMTYIGILLGYSSTDEAMADADIRHLVRETMDIEVTPLLPPSPELTWKIIRRPSLSASPTRPSGTSSREMRLTGR